MSRSWDDPRVLLALAFIFLGAVSLGIYVGLPQTSPEPALSWMGHSAEGRIPGMASPTEINGLRNAPPEQADTQFLRLMIPHHQSAVMAEVSWSEAANPKLWTCPKDQSGPTSRD